MQTDTIHDNKYTYTVLLLCIGYFIDFYDLTIFATSYPAVIHDLFGISNTQAIQLLFLKLTNYNTAGIIVGGILFGILGDKFGRTTVLRYSILIYSISIIASISTHSIMMFSFLRFCAGVGLVTEFATSSVLISEMLPNKGAIKATTLLYLSGILGGMAAVFIGIFSWRVMFFFGGGGGLILFILRQYIFESPLYLQMPATIDKGRLSYLFSNKTNLIQLLQQTCLIIPFYFLIAVMLIIPNFMHLTIPLSSAIHTLLIGFFAGNLISTIVYNYLLVHLRSFKKIFIINTLIFCIVLVSFTWVNQSWFFIYTLMLGILGGGLPSVWIQLVNRSYATNHRNTATNFLYIIGRGSGLGFNALLSIWLVGTHEHLIYYYMISVVVITVCSLIAASTISKTYQQDVNYLS